MFVVSKKVVPLHPKSIGLWCNGNTADSGPAFPGSSPGSPTARRADTHVSARLFFTPILLLYKNNRGGDIEQCAHNGPASYF